ncbi:MAG: hypothetical protein KKA05_10595, partial [Alphaproteobacteria bacterium]|nr:hypothetical protein [Alphaproteobacteria bacterium]
AQGGDIEALQNITSSANEYLSAAQQYFGSGQGYTEIFDAVTTALDALGNQQFVDPLIETLEAEMAALRAAIAAAALDIITTLNGGTVITDAATVVTPADTPPITTDYGVTGNGGYTDYSDLANPMAPANDTDAILEALQSIGDQISDTLGNQTNALVASNDQGFAGLTGAVVDTTSIGVALAGGVVKKVAKP